MQNIKLTRTQAIIAIIAVLVITFGLSILGPLLNGNAYYLLARLGTALTISVLIIFVGWFVLGGASRLKVFGLFFVLLGLMIVTTPLRLQANHTHTERQLSAVEAILGSVSEGESIERQQALTTATGALAISDKQAENLLSGTPKLADADSFEYSTLVSAGNELQATLDAATAFSPEAVSTMRYGDVRENAPASDVPTRTWLWFTGFSFLIGGLVGIFLPAKLNEWLQLALTALILLILTPLLGSVMQAVVAILQRGALESVPAAVWWAIGIVAFLAGIGAIAYFNRGREYTVGTTWLIVNGILLLPTVLIASTVGKQTNVLTMLAESLRLATPIVIGAIAGIWSERAGVVNIAIEGMMLSGACFGFTALFFLGDVMDSNTALFFSVLVALATGGLMALLHAWLSITFKTNQIVSGTVINILAIGLTSFVRRQWLLSTDAGRVTLPNFAVPVLSKIPLIGPVLFDNKPIFYSMFILLLVTYYLIFHTSWGLRIRAVGEHPHAADTVGINVFRTRYIAVFVSGLIAGLGGAWFSLETVGGFDDLMTAGRGFIALAAMIFGKWTPGGAFFGGLLFGFADALGTRFQILDVPVPPQFLQILPYFATMVVLAGLIGRATPPAADGIPYEK